jgi:succinate dehydrogenase flavin-adding protein (antitoxin of CptAB toxin-antitoxin module)
MTLDYSEANVVKSNMTDYVRKILDEVLEEMDGTATSPAADYLFRIVNGMELLDDVRSESFHATVAKLLFLCKRGRPDIQTAIAFLCTRVQQLTKRDFNKLSRVINTSDMQLTSCSASVRTTSTSSNGGWTPPTAYTMTCAVIPVAQCQWEPAPSTLRQRNKN